MDIIFWIGLVSAACLGLIFGSFATAMASRIPEGVSWSFYKKNKGQGDGVAMSRSACPHCGRTLSAIDLVPLFSWICLGGRCRTCRAPIGWSYPLTEALAAAACIGIFLVYGLTPASLGIMLAVPFLVALLVIDLRHFLLPNSLNLILGVLGFVMLLTGYTPWLADTALPSRLIQGVAGAVIFAVSSWLIGFVMKKILKKEALGFGDVKFFAVAGLWLGPGALPLFLMFSGVFGVIIGGVYRMLTKEMYFPFGPALIVAFYGLILFSETLRHVFPSFYGLS
jgi:leader peptidase (prepilin peptidase)/N-methyltransferase